MGPKASKNHRDSRPNSVNQSQNSKIQDDIKILVLGTGESGKSTVLKQMKILYGSGYSDEECKDYKQTIIINTIQSLVSVINAMAQLNIEFADQEASNEVENFLEYANASLFGEFNLTSELISLMQKMRSDAGFQECFTRSNEYRLDDCAEYFLDNLNRILQSDYVPTQQDVLMSRTKTSGIRKYEFDIEGLKLKIFDVGGTRSERKKWHNIFENVTAIIYCVALSEYDLVLHEDDDMNRMIESLKLFDTTCNSKWFKDTPIVLFFTKVDIFKKKIESSPLTICFPEYAGSNTYEEALNFIISQFESLDKQKEHRKILTYFTCTTDTDNMQFLLDGVTEEITKLNFKDFVTK